ncbi:hypothetical protein Plo01_18510 [Planobispora longispora]|uniref:Uncharacterized protein n=1 Tax=Planobispora longispora TaxID=28887 RepID=A0A8J3W456_9ACTN|nr:hypothetical protein Plo01_18510 [Planobispora longispora]
MWVPRAACPGTDFRPGCPIGCQGRDLRPIGHPDSPAEPRSSAREHDDTGNTTTIPELRPGTSQTGNLSDRERGRYSGSTRMAASSAV